MVRQHTRPGTHLHRQRSALHLWPHSTVCSAQRISNSTQHLQRKHPQHAASALQCSSRCAVLPMARTLTSQLYHRKRQSVLPNPGASGLAETKTAAAADSATAAAAFGSAHLWQTAVGCLLLCAEAFAAADSLAAFQQPLELIRCSNGTFVALSLNHISVKRLDL